MIPLPLLLKLFLFKQTGMLSPRMLIRQKIQSQMLRLLFTALATGGLSRTSGYTGGRQGNLSNKPMLLWLLRTLAQRPAPSQQRQTMRSAFMNGFWSTREKAGMRQRKS